MGNRQDDRSSRTPGYGPPPSAPREGADNIGGYPREGGFTNERGFGHIPGQRWSGGYGGDAATPQRSGTDLGMGAPPQDHGPHYGKGPKGYKRSDTRIHDDVCDAIADQGFIDATDVEVRVVERIVTLSGTVMHRHEKKGLEHIAEHVRGVDEVHNELRLRRPPNGKAEGS